MFHISLIFLPLIFTILTMTMASPCPAEFIVDEFPSNNPSTTITDRTINDLIDDKLLEDYLDQFTTASQSETSSLYPLFRQTKSLNINGQRNKRPSWAAVGKRATSFRNKRPSWAQVG